MRGFKRTSRCTGLHPHQARCWAPEGGSRRGAHQRMSRRRRGSACCRGHYLGGGTGRRESAPPRTTTSHRAGGPLLGLGHLSPTLPGTPAPTTHGDMGGEGRAAGGWVSHSPSHGRAASVALASCLLGGGGCGHPRLLRRRPRLHCPPYGVCLSCCLVGTSRRAVSKQKPHQWYHRRLSVWKSSTQSHSKYSRLMSASLDLERP